MCRVEVNTISPKRSKLKYSEITKACGKVTSMLSYFSKSLTASTGRITGVGVIVLPVEQIKTWVTGEISVIP